MSSSLVRRRLGVLLLGIVCSSAMAGCIAAIDESESGEEENLDATRQALNPLYFQTTWTKGDPGHIDVAPVADYFCALTGVSGILRGFGEELYVWANDGLTPTWQLHGKSNQNGTTGTVTCYRRSDFVGVGPANQLSVEYTLQANGNDTSCDYWDHFPPGCPVQAPPSAVTKPLWQGDAVAMLTGIAGDFRGSGEFVEVRQSATGAGVTQLAAQCQVDDDHVRARAYEFFVGTPFGERPARFVGPGGKGTANVGEYKAGGVSGLQSVRMAKRSEAFCYLTHIGGAFSNAQNSVSIVKDDAGYWALDVNSPGSSKSTARARCMLLDQR